jgi:hypothetical protein
MFVGETSWKVNTWKTEKITLRCISREIGYRDGIGLSWLKIMSSDWCRY